MSVFKSEDNNELIVTCTCGCDEMLHIAVLKIDDDCYSNVMYSSPSKDSFKLKLEKIWSILRGKDYYYHDVLMTKDEYKTFCEWVINSDIGV